MATGINRQTTKKNLCGRLRITHHVWNVIEGRVFVLGFCFLPGALPQLVLEYLNESRS